MSLRRKAGLAIGAAALALLASPGQAGAHINSPDLFHEGMAGPYRLLVTIRPPEVIPGVAEIEVLAQRPDLRVITLVPIPIRGPGALSAPIADVAVRAPEDPRLYRGRLWLMATGSWQVRVHADGPDGAGELSVPVAALAVRTKQMQVGMGILLLALLTFLVAGMVSIIGASVRDAALPPGAPPDARRRNRARAAQILTAALLVAGIAAGRSWWGREARSYSRMIYKPLAVTAKVTSQTTAAAAATATATAATTTTPAAASPPTDVRVLQLALNDPGWLPARRLDDLLPDHGHLMHLFAVRFPGLDAIAHLHPTEIAPGQFTQSLPGLPAGTYRLFADVVHGNGLAETATTTLDLSAGGTGAPAGDDAVGQGEPIAGGIAARAPAGGASPDPTASLPDGTRIVWLREQPAAPLLAGRPGWFRFRVEDRDRQPVRDLVPYMGMAGHAVFLAHDGSVFAHVHPTGSVPMAALALVAAGSADPHAGHQMHDAALPAELAFPYACPRAGDYRIFVQVRRQIGHGDGHGGVIETATFDTHVASP